MDSEQYDVVVGSDEDTHLVHEVVRLLEEQGHRVSVVGPAAGEELHWGQVGRAVADAVASGTASHGFLMCWTGTGVSMAANRVTGVRAALCLDVGTAEGARKWNDANILVMSNRTTTPAVAAEMLGVWFRTEMDPEEAAAIASLDSR